MMGSQVPEPPPEHLKGYVPPHVSPPPPPKRPERVMVVPGVYVRYGQPIASGCNDPHCDNPCCKAMRSDEKDI